MTHSWTQLGLGEAPFRIVGFTEKVGPWTVEDPKSGLELQVGAPGQPMGTCAVCSMGIRYVAVCQSADGKRFDVGCDCVMKIAGDGIEKNAAEQLTARVRRLQNQHRKAKEVERIHDAELALRTGKATAAVSLPHPTESLAQRGLTLADWLQWQFKNAGHAGRLKAARKIESLIRSGA